MLSAAPLLRLLMDAWVRASPVRVRTSACCRAGSYDQPLIALVQTNSASALTLLCPRTALYRTQG